MVVGIGGGKEQTWTSAYDANTGLVEGLGNLRVSRISGKVTTLQDINGNYFKTTELDGNGRPRRIAFGLRRKEVRHCQGMFCCIVPFLGLDYLTNLNLT